MGRDVSKKKIVSSSNKVVQSAQVHLIASIIDATDVGNVQNPSYHSSSLVETSGRTSKL